MNRCAVVLSPTPSHPTMAGNRARIYEMAKRLRSYGFKIVLIYLALEGDEGARSMRAFWDDIRIVPAPETIPNFEYLDINSYHTLALRSAIMEVCKLHSPSLFLCNYVWMAGALDAVPLGPIKIIETHDRFACRHDILALLGSEPSWISLALHQEAAAAAKADAIWCVSEEETHYFQRICDKPVYYIGHPVQSQFVFKRNNRPRPMFFFLGSHNAINEQAVNVILDIAPRIKESADFLIGGKCSRFVDIATKPQNVHTIELIPSLAEVFAAGHIAIIPIFNGTGNKIKTIDSIRFGAPVVAGKAGFEGVATTEPLHCLPTLAEFERALLRIARGEASIDKLAQASRKIFTDYEAKSRHAFEQFLAGLHTSNGAVSISYERPANRRKVEPLKKSAASDDSEDGKISFSRDASAAVAIAGFEAGLVDDAYEALRAALALDPTSMGLQLARAYAALSHEHLSEAFHAHRSYEYLKQKGVEDYAPQFSIANAVPLISAGPSAEGNSTLRRQVLSAVQLAASAKPLHSSEARRLRALVAHMKREHVEIRPCALARGRLQATLEFNGRYDLLVMIPPDLQGGSGRDLLIKCPMPIERAVARQGSETIALFRLTKTSYYLPAAVLDEGSERTRLIEVDFWTRPSNSFDPSFVKSVEIKPCHVANLVPSYLRSSLESGSCVELAREFPLNEDVLGEGWHGHDTIGENEYGRWTRQVFTLSVRPVGGDESFLELVIGGTRQQGDISSFEARLSGQALPLKLVKEDWLTRVWVQIPTEEMSGDLLEIEFHSPLQEEVASVEDSRLISVYVTTLRIWSLHRNKGLQEAYEIRINPDDAMLMQSPGVEVRLPRGAPPLAGIILNVESDDELLAGDLSVEINGQSLAPVESSGGPGRELRFAFDSIQSISPSHGSLTVRGPELARSSIHLKSITAQPEPSGAKTWAFECRQAVYWNGFYDCELISDGMYGRWMESSGELKFPARRASRLDLYLYRDNGLVEQNALSFELNGSAIVPSAAWTDRHIRLMFNLDPANAGHQTLAIRADHTSVLGGGDFRQVSILVDRFVIHRDSAQERDS